MCELSAEQLLRSMRAQGATFDLTDEHHIRWSAPRHLHHHVLATLGNHFEALVERLVWEESRSEQTRYRIAAEWLSLAERIGLSDIELPRLRFPSSPRTGSAHRL